MPSRLRAFRRNAAVALIAGVMFSAVALGLAPTPAVAVTLAANNDSATVIHDHTLVKAAPGVLANDLNVGGGTVLRVSGPAHGALTLRSDGSYTYMPDAGYVGTDSFSYKVRSLLLVTSNTAQVTITVTNALPVARNDAYTWAGGPLNVAAPGVLGNDTDADGDTLTAELVGGGVSGSLDLNANGSFQLRPGGGFGSSGSFQYRISDGIGWSATVTVTLTIVSATPTPSPSPSPTPRPTPRPTPTPLPSLPVPSLPLPSIGLAIVPGSQSTPRPTPASSATIGQETPRPSPATSASSGASPGPDSISFPSDVLPPTSGGSGGNDASDGQSAFTIGRPSADGGGLGLALGTLGLIGGVEIWAVPAATVGGVGLLVLLFAGLQAGGTIIWLPAVRRLRGERTPRRRRRR